MKFLLLVKQSSGKQNKLILLSINVDQCRCYLLEVFNRIVLKCLQHNAEAYNPERGYMLVHNVNAFLLLSREMVMM